jgi:hypothetical protein
MSQVAPGGLASDAFLDRAYPRIIRISLVLAVAGTIAVLVVVNAAASAGFAAGAAATILNFVWLHRAVKGLIDQMVTERGASSRFRMTLSFLGRYALVAIIAYAIFKSSAHAFVAFLAALPLPILAAMCEAIYEAVVNTKDPDSTNS